MVHAGLKREAGGTVVNVFGKLHAGHPVDGAAGRSGRAYPQASDGGRSQAGDHGAHADALFLVGVECVRYLEVASEISLAIRDVAGNQGRHAGLVEQLDIVVFGG